MKFIAVTGIIGAGKSSVAQALSKVSGFPLVPEDFGENPFLAPYYENPKRYAAQMQMWFLLRRLEQLEALSDGTYVLDQPLGAFGYVFPVMQNHAGLLPPDATRSIITLWKQFESGFPYQQYCVLLDVDVETALARIKKRGRQMESNISEDYLTQLSKQYSKFFEDPGQKSTGITISNNDDSPVEQVAKDILALYHRGVSDTVRVST